jgi:hypothetical protein
MGARRGPALTSGQTRWFQKPPGFGRLFCAVRSGERRADRRVIVEPRTRKVIKIID